jgi:hypothetical protein
MVSLEMVEIQESRESIPAPIPAPFELLAAITEFLTVRSPTVDDPRSLVKSTKPEPIAAPFAVQTFKRPSTIVRLSTFAKPDPELYPEPIPEPEEPLAATTPPRIASDLTIVWPEPKRYPDPIPEPCEQEAFTLLLLITSLATIELSEFREPDPIPEPNEQEGLTPEFTM